MSVKKQCIVGIAVKDYNGKIPSFEIKITFGESPFFEIKITFGEGIVAES